MAATLLSKPTLSSIFLGQQLCNRGNSKSSPQCGWILSKRSQSRGLSLMVPRCAVDTASFGGNIPKFSRVNVWDPYKRLGITRDASEEEVWGARNFLLDQYSGHERSMESIEAAFEKILMASYLNRKKTKINLKTRLKKKVEESPPWVKNLLSFVEMPPGVIILRRLFLFGFMAVWSVMNAAEAGPAFQVCVAFPVSFTRIAT
ncbi:protein CHAPERONE-LIKE PROTEIN OF POR1, chloroplastic-like [Ipomoea triloba]|uniref:protein CHAPERONE-LIKE PROTEIN OF POR1, chloroplastic-like n=1 Tax=Ipomoea triloba TaxID=35885 RepID=UPI00125D0C4F|nr:protein CHAPERONE-LIKE PROTEIN OF POR1, chloroplastic-like [Ipomoea triloba]